jgi:hypothetical protein
VKQRSEIMAIPERDTVYSNDGNRTVYTRESSGTGWFVGIIVALALLAIGYLVFSANSGPSTTVDVNGAPATTEAPADPALAPAPMTEAAPATDAAPMTEAPAVDAAPATEAPAVEAPATEAAPAAEPAPATEPATTPAT